MKIVFTSTGEGWDSKVDPRFGRTDYLFSYNEDTEEIITINNIEVQNAAHGAGPQTAKKLFELEPDVLITGNGPGGNASAVLEKSEVKIFTGASDMTLKEAYQAYKDGKLNSL